MDVRNCRQCGKLYNYIGGSYRNLCPSCIKQLEDKFMEIKEYIRKQFNVILNKNGWNDCMDSTSVLTFRRFQINLKSAPSRLNSGCVKNVSALRMIHRSGCSVSAVVQRLRQGVTVISVKGRWQTSWIICIRHRHRHQGQAGIVTMQE